MNITKEISNNLKVFEALKELAFNETDINKKLKLLQYTSMWAVREHTGKFSDLQIEQALSNIATQYPTEKQDFNKNTFLHVMTECSNIGGHTRIVEKWMNASSKEEVHSLLLIKQKTEIPEWLTLSTNTKQGTIYKLPINNSTIQKALELRKTASKYEYIILHIHMDDIIPILAFATESFERPIVFVNHGDHLFWLGISITDSIYDASQAAVHFTKSKRGNLLSSIVPVPLQFGQECNTSKSTILDTSNLGTSQETKVILSMANSYKYHYLDDYAFIKMGLKILEENSNTIFIVIGADKEQEKPWQDAYESSGKRFIAVGLKTREEVSLYKAISNLYIDSFPFNSYTAFLECASNNIPSLSLKTEFNSLDVLINTPNQCKSIDELIDKASKLLQSSTDTTYDISKKIIDYHSIDNNWIHCKDKLIEKTPAQHTLHWKFSDKNDIDNYDKMLYALTPGNKRKMPFEKTINFKNNWQILIILYKNKKLSGSGLLNYTFKVLKYAFR